MTSTPVINIHKECPAARAVAFAVPGLAIMRGCTEIEVGGVCIGQKPPYSIGASEYLVLEGAIREYPCQHNLICGRKQGTHERGHKRSKGGLWRYFHA